MKVLSTLVPKKAVLGTVHGQSQEQSPETLPSGGDSNPVHLLSSPSLYSKAWYVLNTLSSSQHVFPYSSLLATFI